MGKIKLNVLGISYSQTQSGAYALVLSEEEGNRRIPIIVGGFEAQAIAIELEGLAPPRPLTHDLFKNFADSYGITIIEVNIHKLEDGVFFAPCRFDHLVYHQFLWVPIAPLLETEKVGDLHIPV